MFEIPDSYVKTSIPHYSIWRGATWGRMESDGDGLDFGKLYFPQDYFLNAKLGSKLQTPLGFGGVLTYYRTQENLISWSWMEGMALPMSDGCDKTQMAFFTPDRD